MTTYQFSNLSEIHFQYSRFFLVNSTVFNELKKVFHFKLLLFENIRKNDEIPVNFYAEGFPHIFRLVQF